MATDADGDVLATFSLDSLPLFQNNEGRLEVPLQAPGEGRENCQRLLASTVHGKDETHHWQFALAVPTAAFAAAPSDLFMVYLCLVPRPRTRVRGRPPTDTSGDGTGSIVWSLDHGGARGDTEALGRVVSTVTIHPAAVGQRSSTQAAFCQCVPAASLYGTVHLSVTSLSRSLRYKVLGFVRPVPIGLGAPRRLPSERLGVSGATLGRQPCAVGGRRGMQLGGVAVQCSCG